MYNYKKVTTHFPINGISDFLTKLDLPLETVDNSFKKLLKSFGIEDLKLNEFSFNLNDGFPKIELSEDNNFYIAKFLVPGLKKDQIKISIEEDKLHFEMEKFEKDENERLLYTEIKRSACKRTILLGQNVDKSEIKASLDSGILTVRLKKIAKEDIKKTVNIEIV